MAAKGIIQPSVVQAGNIVSVEQAQDVVKPFAKEGVKQALFSIEGRKSPGPNNFNSSFLKMAWVTLGDDIYDDVSDFFHTGKMLRKINATNLALIPKVNNSICVTDFRHIACYNSLQGDF
ncbi:hypothetical protein RDABS01_004539 [Bienertia sinuspersici]